MARRPRLFAAGLLYHVIARRNQRQLTLLGDDDYGAYLQRLAVYRARYAVTLLAYCLMPNHVHLLVRTGDVPLAKFMQGLQQSYTQWFNRLHEKVGHVSGPRALVAFVLVRRFGYRLSDVARALGRDPATVGTAIARLVGRLTRDSTVAGAASQLEKCREVKV